MHNFDPSDLDPATADGALNYNVYSLWSPILHPQICGFLPCPLQLTNCLCSSKPLRTAHEGGSILMWCLVETKARYDWAIIEGEQYESSHCSRFRNGDFSVLRRQLWFLPLLFLIAFAFTSENCFDTVKKKKHHSSKMWYDIHRVFTCVHEAVDFVSWLKCVNGREQWTFWRHITQMTLSDEGPLAADGRMKTGEGRTVGRCTSAKVN